MKVAVIVNRTRFIKEQMPKFVHEREGLLRISPLLFNNDERAFWMVYRKTQNWAFLGYLPLTTVPVTTKHENAFSFDSCTISIEVIAAGQTQPVSGYFGGSFWIINWQLWVHEPCQINVLKVFAQADINVTLLLYSLDQRSHLGG